MNPILSSILFGVLGGFVRALVGIANTLRKTEKTENSVLAILLLLFLWPQWLADLLVRLPITIGGWRLLSDMPELTFWKGCTKLGKGRDLKFDALSLAGGAILVKYNYEVVVVEKRKTATLKIMDQDNKNNEGIDLSGALKDSDSGGKFQDKWCRPAQTFYPGTPKIIRWVVKYSGGLIKDEKQASYVLIGFVAVAIVVALVLIFGNGGGQNTPSPESYINKQQFLPKK